MNRTDRLVAIVLHLQGRRLVRAEDLARRFEISLRTVYRDMAALAEAGVPIAGEAGVGYSLVKGYHLPPVMLTAEEAGALFLGGELVREFTDASLRGPSASALDKLRAVLPPEQRDQVERTARTTVVLGGCEAERAGTGSAPAVLRPLQEAVARRQVVRMRYRGRDDAEERSREVEPLGVIFYGGRWYLVAWCRLRDALRHFRLDRIAACEVSSRVFPVRTDFDLAKHIVDYGGSGPAYPARVWFSDRAIGRARHESHATLAEEARRGEGAEYSMLTWSHEWLATWLISFGGEAEALEPSELRKRVRSLAEGALQRHVNGAPAAKTKFRKRS
jgi:Predicted transcriptional regulator